LLIREIRGIHRFFQSSHDGITSQTITHTNRRTAVALLRRRMTAAVPLITAAGGGWDVSSLTKGLCSES
jgi:outer membrane protein TolC